MIKKTESREISTQTSVMCSDGSFSLSSAILPWNGLLPGVQYYKEYSLSFLRLLLLIVSEFPTTVHCPDFNLDFFFVSTDLSIYQRCEDYLSTKIN